MPLGRKPHTRSVRRRFRFRFGGGLQKVRNQLHAVFNKLRHKHRLNPALPYAQVSVSTPCTARLLELLKENPKHERTNGWWNLLRKLKGAMFAEVGHGQWKDVETLEICDDDPEVMFRKHFRGRLSSGEQV